MQFLLSMHSLLNPRSKVGMQIDAHCSPLDFLFIVYTRRGRAVSSSLSPQACVLCSNNREQQHPSSESIRAVYIVN